MARSIRTPDSRTIASLGTACRALALAIAVCGAPTAAQQSVDWALRTPATAPPARWLHRMAWDGLRERMVVFGGQDQNGAQFADTWTWDGASWTQAASAVAPPARHGHGMAFDARRGRIVLFGGLGSAGTGGTLLQDTWEWDGMQWHAVATGAAPPARSNLGMCFDNARGVVVAFGGAGSSAALGDTWTWNGASWTQANPAVSPPARTSHVMAFDPSRGEALVFGGVVAGANADDTWTWNGTTWTARVVSPRPVPRRNAVHAEDPVRRRLVLYGGYAQLGVTYGDQWAWDGTAWSQLTTASTPPARENSALAWDARRQRLVLFAGYRNQAPLAETWELGSAGFVGDAAPYGRGCGTPELRLAAVTMPRVGAPLVLEVRNVAAGFALLAFGLSATQAGAIALPLDLTALGTPGCLLLHDLALAFAQQTLPLGLATWTWNGSVPANPALLGVQVFAQGWTTTGNPAASVDRTSNGLRLVVGN